MEQAQMPNHPTDDVKNKWDILSDERRNINDEAGIDNMNNYKLSNEAREILDQNMERIMRKAENEKTDTSSEFLEFVQKALTKSRGEQNKE